MNNYNEEEKKYQDLLGKVKDAFSEEQTEPRASVKYTLKQRLREQRKESFWQKMADIIQFNVPVYQPALAFVAILIMWYSFKAVPIVQIVEKQQPVYVYKTDTLKVPVKEYVYVKAVQKIKAKKEQNNNLEEEPPMTGNTVIANAPFPDSAIRFAESQTGRSLHDDSTYMRLFVSLK